MPIYFDEAQLQASFCYGNLGGLIADDKVVNIENAVDCKIQAFNNIIDFYREDGNG